MAAQKPNALPWRAILAIKAQNRAKNTILKNAREHGTSKSRCSECCQHYQFCLAWYVNVVQSILPALALCRDDRSEVFLSLPATQGPLVHCAPSPPNLPPPTKLSSGPNLPNADWAKGVYQLCSSQAQNTILPQPTNTTDCPVPSS